MSDWRTRKLYRVGERASWRGVRLVCTREHYAGEAAEHPWDPGDGWTVQRAATLWAPNGPVEAGRLASRQAYGCSERLREVIAVACGESVA